MKKILILTALIGLLLVGCQQDNSIVSPMGDNTGSSSVIEPNWISFPPPAHRSAEKVFYLEEWVDPSHATNLKIKDRYDTPDGPHEEVKVDCKLKFMPGAVTEPVLVSWEYDDESGISTFLPHQLFYAPVELTVKVYGMELVPGDELLINFYYFWNDENGVEHVECIDYSQLNIDIDEGSLELRDAIIPHFSRFGFAR